MIFISAPYIKDGTLYLDNDDSFKIPLTLCSSNDYHIDVNNNLLVLDSINNKLFVVSISEKKLITTIYLSNLSDISHIRSNKKHILIIDGINVQFISVHTYQITNRQVLDMIQLDIALNDSGYIDRKWGSDVISREQEIVINGRTTRAKFDVHDSTCVRIDGKLYIRNGSQKGVYVYDLTDPLVTHDNVLLCPKVFTNIKGRVPMFVYDGVPYQNTIHQSRNTRVPTRPEEYDRRISTVRPKEDPIFII